MKSTGRVTIPTDESFVEWTKEIMQKWGADAVRDCDGTRLPTNAKELGKVYKYGLMKNCRRAYGSLCITAAGSSALASRRLVSKTSTSHALTPVYLPYIDRISGVKDDCGVKS